MCCDWLRTSDTPIMTQRCEYTAVRVVTPLDEIIPFNLYNTISTFPGLAGCLQSNEEILNTFDPKLSCKLRALGLKWAPKTSRTSPVQCHHPSQTYQMCIMYTCGVRSVPVTDIWQNRHKCKNEPCMTRPQTSKLSSGRTGSSLQMNRLSLRNNRLKFKIAGKLPIILEEFMEYTPI